MSHLLEEQLLSYSENAENEGEEVEYLEEEELQVRRSFLSPPSSPCTTGTLSRCVLLWLPFDLTG